MSETAFDQSSIDLLGASETLMVLLEGRMSEDKQQTRLVFRILYEVVPKHKKNERCQAAQHLAKRLWSSQAVRLYGLRSSNAARILDMADVVDLDGRYELLTDPLTLFPDRRRRLPWTYLERFCRHLASTHIAY